MIAAALLVAGAAVMLPVGDLHRLGSVAPFLLGASIMLAGFALGLWKQSRMPLLAIGIAAVAARVLLLFQAPGGDIHRYIWEGDLLLHGINPYLNAPDAAALAPVRDATWTLVEHKSFTAIYPPLAEWAFAAMALAAPNVIFFKAVFAAADLLAGALLWRRFGGPAALIYLWNPLVIYSAAGGGHYDSLFVLALVLGWFAWDRERPFAAVLLVGAAVALKWVALPILGWMLWRRLRTAGVVPGLVAGLAGALPLLASWLAVNLWTGEWAWQLQPGAFTEYARSAEFIPRIVAWAWEASRYHNSWFLPPLALLWAFVIFRTKRFATAAEWSFFFTLILSPLVHAWYFTWLMPFAVATRNRGSVLLTGAAFVYFVVYHRFHARPDLGWTFTPAEIAAIWTPFVVGFLWTFLCRPTGQPPLLTEMPWKPSVSS